MKIVRVQMINNVQLDIHVKMKVAPQTADQKHVLLQTFVVLVITRVFAALHKKLVAMKLVALLEQNALARTSLILQFAQLNAQTVTTPAISTIAIQANFA